MSYLLVENVQFILDIFINSENSLTINCKITKSSKKMQIYSSLLPFEATAMFLNIMVLPGQEHKTVKIDLTQPTRAEIICILDNFYTPV